MCATRVLGLASAVLLFWPVASFPQHVVTVEKIPPQLRQRAQSEPRLGVLIVLRDQPQPWILERVHGAASLRIGIAEGEYNRLASLATVSRDLVQSARDQLDQLIVEARQTAAREIEAAIRPQRESVAARLSGWGARVLQQYTMTNMLAVDLPASAIAALEADPDVAEVAPIEQHSSDLESSVPGFGTAAFWTAGFTGAGQSVAVLDTGIKENHPAFAGKEFVSRAFVSNAAGDPCFNDDQTAADHQGHGSHVAGIVASGGSPGFTADMGVARGLSRIYNLKIGWLPKSLPSCKYNSFNSDVVAALDWALQNTPVRIFNYSYGGDTDQDDTSSARIFDQIVEQNKVIVAISAGNSGPDPHTIGSPGIAYNIISVANYDDHQSTNRDNFDIHYSSSRGPTPAGRFKPDIAAPGTSILSTNYANDNFVRKTGTSMAAPHVAGAAALIVQSGVTDPLAVKALLINTTDNFGWKPDRAWGFANLKTARERNYYFLSSAAGTRPVFFTGAAKDNFSATLVWNRHIVVTSSTTAYLNHLGLYLYNRTTNTLLSKSEDALQNVQQVLADKAAPVVIKVEATAPLYAGGVSTEPFALAPLDAGFVTAAGPSLAISCTPPSTVAPGAAFSINCTARNTGDLDAFAVIGSLNAPAGFSAAGNQTFGTIAPGATASQAFSLTAASNAGNYPFQVSLTSSSYGEAFTAAASFNVSVGGAGGPALVVNPTAFTFSGQAGGAAPAAQPLAISGGAFAYSISIPTSATWLRVTPQNGNAPATPQVSVITTGLAAGVYNATVTITAAGAANSPQVIGVTLNLGATATITLDARLLTKSVPSGCTVPTESTSFLSSDARALVWFLVKNARAGDRPRVEWYSPDGALYQSASFDAVTTAGGYCFWAGVDIAGNPPASLPGSWSVKIYWNGAPAATLPFTIGSPVTVVNKMLARSVDLSACAAPSPVTQFLPRDTQALVWFSVSKARAGDRPSVQWLSPDGKVYQTDTFDPLVDGGDWCFYDTLQIAGNAPASLPGAWSVRVLWNDSLIFTLPFTIAAPPAVLAKVTTSTLPTGCKEPPVNSIFLPRDPRATVWFYVQNVQPGDQASYAFYDPAGNLYDGDVFDPADSGGDWCFWAWIDVAGEPAASAFGTWTVKVNWNDVPLFEQNFRILPVLMDTAVTSKTVTTNACVAPPVAEIFTPVDQRAYIWFQVRDAQAGDAPRVEFYDPGGGLYSSLLFDPVPAGNRCFWSWIDVAGNPAAARPGAWTAKVYWNQSALTSLPFTITPIAYENAMVTKAAPAGNGCPVPTPATSFAPSDAQAVAWFLARNAKAGDQPSGAWYDPNGKVFRPISWAPVSSDGSYCFFSTLTIKSQPPASFPGVWNVKVNWNSAPLFSLNFTILDNAGPSGLSADTIVIDGGRGAARVNRTPPVEIEDARRDTSPGAPPAGPISAVPGMGRGQSPD